MARAPIKDANIKKSLSNQKEINKETENEEEFSSWTAKISSKKI